MNAGELSAIVSSVGFPVVACCGLCWYIYRQSQTIAAFTKSIDKLTNALNRAIDRLSKKESDDT